MDTPLSIPAAFAFHSEVTHGATAFLHEMIQVTLMDLNNTERAISDNNLTQAIAYLHKAQLQLNQLNNNTLLQNVSTMLVQAGITSNLDPTSPQQSSEIMSTFAMPPLSSSIQSVPDPQIPQSLTVIEKTDDNIRGQSPLAPNLNSKIITPSDPQSQAFNLPDGSPPISSTPTTRTAPPSSISSEIEPLSPTTAPLKDPSVPGLPPISSSR